MNKFEQFCDKLNIHARNLYDKVNGKLNTAFPDVFVKRVVVVTFIAIEFLIAYIIAILDIGLQVGDCTPFGIIAAYWVNKQTYPLITFLLFGGLLAIGFYVYIDKALTGNTGRGFTIAESNVYGSARDINRDELEQVAEVKPKEAAMGMILGQLDETETQLITTKNLKNFNKNFLCLAPPGSGKTATIVLNAIIQAIRRGESIITTDTKGEIWAKTVELARLHGYIVRRFDLKNPQFSDGWDILSEVRMDVDRAGIIASIVMANTSAPGEKDIHAGAEESLLTALLLYQCLEPGIPPEQKTLYNAYTMLFQGADGLDVIFNAIQDDPDMRPAYEYYTGALRGSPNLKGNIVSGLSKRLSPLSNPPIRELTSTPDIDLSLPGERKCIYYVEMNDQINNKRFLSSMFFSFVFLDLCDLADNRLDQMLPVPVNVMIEEMYACGYLPTVTNALSTVRSRGISITMIAQGIDQFRILYGEKETNVILDCCATYACLGANSESTSDLFEWLGGNATVDVKTEQHEVMESPIPIGRRYSTGVGRQALYTSNDVRKIKFGHILLVWQRFDPLMTHTFFYQRHPEYMNGHMPEVSGKTRIPLTDKEARQYLRSKEEQRIMDYEAWIEKGGNPWEGYLEPAHNGPTTKDPMPKITPYPNLEQEALDHSAQARGVQEANLMEQIVKSVPVEPPDDQDPANIDPHENDDNQFDDDEELNYDDLYASKGPQGPKNDGTSDTPGETGTLSEGTSIKQPDITNNQVPAFPKPAPADPAKIAAPVPAPASGAASNPTSTDNTGPASGTEKTNPPPIRSESSASNPAPSYKGQTVHQPQPENPANRAQQNPAPVSKTPVPRKQSMAPRKRGMQSAIILDDTQKLRKNIPDQEDQVGEPLSPQTDYDSIMNNRADSFSPISKKIPKK